MVRNEKRYRVSDAAIIRPQQSDRCSLLFSFITYLPSVFPAAAHTDTSAAHFIESLMSGT